MKNFFGTLSLVLLPLLFASSAQAQGDQCQPGWELIEVDGEFFCRFIDVQCLGGEERRYNDATTNAHLCCNPLSKLVIYDEKTQVGVCCGTDQVYTGIKPNGKCCPPKSVLNSAGQCIPAPPPNSCQGCPAQQPGACQLQVSCGDNTYNGLQYGRCYQLFFPTGKQLGRGPSYATDDTYTQDGRVQNIPYQICQAPSACGTGPVKSTDFFYIKDLVGPADNSAPFGFMTGPPGGGHMTVTADTTPANLATFKARTSCWSCKCVVELLAMGYACPNAQPGITIWQNPKIVLKLQFLEIPCNGKFNFPQN